MIHRTVGYYRNQKYKVNGVKTENLIKHIAFNLMKRPTLAFFVDGICLNVGDVGLGKCEQIAEKIKGITIDEDTAPYV